jgi:uncharacterized protein involved in response to NO
MADGLFGGFIFGFLGTAMPRMLSAQPLGARNVLLLVGLHFAMALSFFLGKVAVGDHLFLALLLVFLLLMGRRAMQRKDTPPPGFSLVGLAFLCVLAGTALAVWQHYQEEPSVYWVLLQRLLSYQGFVLLPILGVGPFILPRFFGLQSPHDFPEMRVPTAEWRRKAALALGVGGTIIGSFFVEAAGAYRLANALRFAATLLYLLLEFPFHRAPKAGSALGASLRTAFAVLVAGFIAVALWPGFRVALLHLTLIGGFAVITFVVATRVVFGHSGNLERLKGRNRWLLVAVGLMLFAMATRISGDFWPAIMASHYIYGAVIWICGVLLWSFYVLPKVRQVEEE